MKHKMIAYLHKLNTYKRQLAFGSAPALLAQADKFDPNRSADELADPAKAYGLLGSLVSNMFELALFAGAIAALIFFFVGAIQWGMAGSGDGAQKGRQTMLYAVIGLVMLGSVYVVILLYNSLLPEASP